LRKLADEVGIHFGSLSHIETGREFAGVETLVRLAEALGAEPDLLLAEAGFRTAPFRVLGDVAAGVPIDAVEDVETFDLAEHFEPGAHYMLRVKGNSMIDDGILEGDLAIIRYTNRARKGQTVVAVVDGDEATLKKFEKKGGNVVLTPANKRMKRMVLSARRVEIRGVFVGLLRLR